MFNAVVTQLDGSKNNNKQICSIKWHEEDISIKIYNINIIIIGAPDEYMMCCVTV